MPSGSVENATKLGPFTGGLHNSSSGEFIDDKELFVLENLEVDNDGSLVNRPEIKLFTTSGFTAANSTELGTYLPNDGRKFIVIYSSGDNKVYLVDAVTGAANAVASPVGVTSIACVQYANRLWVVSKVGASANGGYFDVPTPTSVTWTTVAAMPRGESITQYKERLWIACGIGATSNASRFYFSGVGPATDTWAGTDYVDVAPGNGQKLVSLSRLGSDLMLFKEHSTHRFTYSTDPRKAELTEVDATIGVPAVNCVVAYNNNTIYCLHDNAVYELYQMTYTRISGLIDMEQVSDLDLYTKDQYGLTLHRDRLFVRYFKNLYVYGLKLKRWSTWVSTRKFSKIVVIPSATIGLDTAYAASASQSRPTEYYYFQDLRTISYTGGTPPASSEVFKGKITTKIYDFDTPQSYKVIFWWGPSVATSGSSLSYIVIPNANRNRTWRELRTQYNTWDNAQLNNVQWAGNLDVVIPDTTLVSYGQYARKFYKLLKKLRFRQIYFKLEFDIVGNNITNDSSLRLFDVTVFVKQKATVFKEVS